MHLFMKRERERERERERRGSGLGRAANSYVCKEEAASYSGLIGEE